MTMTVDWDVKNQTKPNQNPKEKCDVIYLKMSSSSVAVGPSLVGEKLTSTGTESENTNTLNILKIT